MNISQYSVLFALGIAVLVFMVMIRIMRHWNHRLLEEVNRKLHLPVSAFLTLNRGQIINRVLNEELLLQRIDEQAEATGQTCEAVRAQCRRYADEIVPAFNAVFYFRIGYLLARSVLKSLYRVHSIMADMTAIDAIESDASVVLVMNHRSNMDVLLVNYLASRRSTVMHIAGEWARMWPLHHIVRMAGNCVTDRDAQDVLYGRVFRAFIQLAVRERTNMAIFPEGELSRTGSMLKPRFGVFSYAVTALPAKAGKLYLIPVGINYDRIPEEDQLVAEPGAVYRRRSKLKMLVSVIHAAVVLTGRVVLPGKAQFGNACACFGRPVSLCDWQSKFEMDRFENEIRPEWISVLGNQMVQDVAALVPVLPTHVLAVLLVSSNSAAWSVQTLAEEGIVLLEKFRRQGAKICLYDADEQQVFVSVVEDFTRRKLVTVGAEGLLAINPEKKRLLNYMANSVSHLLVRA